MINRVVFREGENTVRVTGLWQWDYGQILEIHGLDLPPAVEVHFAEKGSREEATVRIGTTADKVTTVPIPEKYLERFGEMQAYIYVSNEEYGQTEYQIVATVKARQKPEAHERPEDAELFREAIAAVNASAKRAEEAVKNAQEATWNINARSYNATKYGVSTENTGLENSNALQTLIDTLHKNGGGTIYIPAGEYVFAQKYTGDYGGTCVYIRSNVNIVGDGASTVLLPTGTEDKCFNMFADETITEFILNKDGDWPYLENCVFKDCVIDGKDQHCQTYSTSGKGFALLNLKNCHWQNVIVRNMDATGFGMDCPVHCSIVGCMAENCGKAAIVDSPGASGFGIGFGRTIDEYMFISNCRARGNKRFGFFFEDQKRFWPNDNYYPATYNQGMLVSNCISSDNNWNYGCIRGIMATYQGCKSYNAEEFGYYLENSQQCNILSCTSDNEGDAAFVIKASLDPADNAAHPSKDNRIMGCISKLSPYACKIVSVEPECEMTRNIIKDCYFNLAEANTILMIGEMDNLILQNNVSNGAPNISSAVIKDFVNYGNSWNTQYEVDNSLRITSFTSTKPSPQEKGTGVTITATADGGDGTLQYRFYRLEPANATIRVFRDWATSNRTACNPGTGVFLLYAEVRDEAGNCATAQMLYEWTDTAAPAAIAE